MQIKEIEERSGMERGNIRFYEREGLIAPERLANGYRDYSEEDLQVLLRIKLLRSLQISLEDIKALDDGSKDLANILDDHIKKLEQEKNDASHAQDLCQAMREEKETYENLDAMKYLEAINQTSKESSSSYFSIKGDKLSQVYNPWRRYLARSFDFSIYTILWLAFLAFIFQINVSSRGSWGHILDTFMALVLMLFLEPIFLKLFGTTPGKAIFGLRIENKFGKHLSYGDGLERIWSLIRYGYGFNIPIYSIVRLWKSYKRCKDQEVQPWDESISYTIKDTKGYRSLTYIGASVALVFVIYSLFLYQLLPPNRGDITLVQFVQNHNYYARYLDTYTYNHYLDKNGEWVKNIPNISPSRRMPDYDYLIEDGYLSGVSFEIEIKDDDKTLRSYDEEMVLVSLAFIGAQEGTTLFSKAPKRVIEHIRNNTFYDFNFVEADITVTSDTDFHGYIDTQFGILKPYEDADESYFSLKYSMYK